jgi:hypothetical protein
MVVYWYPKKRQCTGQPSESQNSLREEDISLARIAMLSIDNIPCDPTSTLITSTTAPISAPRHSEFLIRYNTSDSKIVRRAIFWMGYF